MFLITSTNRIPHRNSDWRDIKWAFYRFSILFSQFLTMTASSSLRNLSSMNKAVMKPFVQELTLHCADGMKIAAQSWSNIQIKDESSSNVEKKFRFLCLHGWMDNCRSFHHLAPAIVQHMTTMNSSVRQSCEVVALDLPGHGLSSHHSIDGPPALLAEAVFYINEAVLQLNWNDETIPFTVIGHSMGAGLGVLYSASFPEHVDKLVLLDGAGPWPRNGNDLGKHVRQHVLRRHLGLVYDKKHRIYPSLNEAVAARCKTAETYPGKQYLSEAAAREMVTRGTKPVGSNGSVQFVHDQRLTWPSIQYVTHEQVEGLYEDIQCRTALFRATDGWPIEEPIIEKCLELLRPTVCKTLPGSHHFHADPDACEAVASEVIQFVYAT